MNKLALCLLFLTFTLIIVGNVNAQESDYDVFEKDTCISIIQTCADCTSMNITSITAPDSSQVLGFSEMTKTGTEYNQTFCSTNQIGFYKVNGVKDPDGTLSVWDYKFKVTSTGMEAGTSQGIVYLFIGLMMVFFFSLSLFGAIKIPWSHKKNDKGIIVGINDLKYVKLFLWFLTYLLLFFITFTFRYVSLIADFEVAAEFLYVAMMFLLVFLFPVFIILVTTGIIYYLDAKRLEDLLRRGMQGR